MSNLKTACARNVLRVISLELHRSTGAKIITVTLVCMLIYIAYVGQSLFSYIHCVPQSMQFSLGGGVKKKKNLKAFFNVSFIYLKHF